jgi:hypothetical protein
LKKLDTCIYNPTFLRVPYSNPFACCDTGVHFLGGIMKHRPIARSGFTESEYISVEHETQFFKWLSWLKFTDYWSCRAKREYFIENYGSDADGNRGELRTMFGDVILYDFKKNGLDIDDTAIPSEVVDKLNDEAMEMDFEVDYRGGEPDGEDY